MTDGAVGRERLESSTEGLSEGCCLRCLCPSVTQRTLENPHGSSLETLARSSLGHVVV